MFPSVMNKFGVLLVFCWLMNLSECNYGESRYRDEKKCSVALNHPDQNPTWPYANTPITGFLPPVCFRPGYYEGDCPHYCERPCVKGEPPRVCYWRLNIESTKTNNPHACSKECVKDNSCKACVDLDGYETPVQVFNYKYPGPLIYACVGDTIVVDVCNFMRNLSSELLPETSLYRNVHEDMNTFATDEEKQYAPQVARTLYERRLDPLRKWRSLEHADKDLFTSSVGKERAGLDFLPVFDKAGEATTVHWHGNKQTFTMASDGVPIATQKEIEPGQCYRYKMDNDQAGTYFYHSHVSIQRGQGLFGPMIIGHYKDPNCKEYDYSNPHNNIILTDHGHDLSHAADNILLNANGCFLHKGKWIGQTSVLKFKPGYRHILHLIYNGVTATNMLCWLDNHSMKILDLDANPVKPKMVSRIVMSNGERVRVAINFNQKVDNYAFHCVNYANHSLHNVAYIQYEGAPPPPKCHQINFNVKPPLEGLEFNTPNVGAGSKPGSVVVSEFRGYKKLCKACRKKHVRQIFLDFTVSRNGFQINNITNDVDIYPFIDQIYEKGKLDTSNFCNAETLKAQGRNCSNGTCLCNHVYQLKLGDCVELVLMKAPHPAHIHGHMVHEVSRGVVSFPLSKEAFIQADRENKIKRNLIDPPEKDVFLIPRNGYSVLRFCANNAGVWFVHCHIELHGIMGMSLFLVEGTVNQILKKKEIYHNTTAIRNNMCYEDHKDRLPYKL